MGKRGRFRITVRDLIILVAAAAVLAAVMPGARAWFVEIRDRWRLYKDRAEAYERIEANCLRNAIQYEDPMWMMTREAPGYRAAMAEYWRESAVLYGQLKRKYRRAMYRPWAPVPPDPTLSRRMPLKEGESWDDPHTVEINR